MIHAARAVDGRHRRREVNIDAVVEALLGLYREGKLRPSTDEIAARAGISPRSLFRYFADSDTLVRTAIARQQAHLEPFYEHGADPGQALHERIERFVTGRSRLLEEMGNVGRVARARSIDQPLLAKELERIRAALRQQVAELFAPELQALSRRERALALAALDVATSWEAWDLLRRDQDLSRQASADAMAMTVEGILR